MRPTVKVICYRSKTLANGEHPLLLRVCMQRKVRYKSIGLSVNPKDWDFKTNKPKSSCPDRKDILKIISDSVQKMQKKIIHLMAEKGEFKLEELFTEKIPSSNVSEFLLAQVDRFAELERYGNRGKFKNLYNSLLLFTKKKLNIPFSKINVDFLERYEKYLRDKGVSDISIASYFRTLRSLYNKAIRAKCVDIEDYPFKDYKIAKFNLRAKKKAIPKEDVLKIMDVDLSNCSPFTQFSRDIFIFIYLCAGINFGDLIRLTAKNIDDNRLRYQRKKTRCMINIPIIPEALEILQKYSTDPDNYLFSVLDKKVHKTEIQKLNRCVKIIKRINQHLKEIAILAGVKARVTTYVARHAYATVMKNAGVSVALISETLGHTSLTTTQIYLDSFEDSQIDEAMENLL